MDFSEEEISTQELIDTLNRDDLSDWQKVDIAAKLTIKRGRKDIGKKKLEELQYSSDKYSKLDAITYITQLIPHLEKEGKI